MQRNDFFGSSVAVKGDTIAVGAPAHEYLPGIANHGAVYLFTRAGATWTRQQKLVHTDASSDALGSSIAFDGSSIVAGAPAKASNTGAAYVFAQEAVDPNRINGNETAQSSFFGENVDIDGDTAVVGAAFDEVNGVRTGAAYVFVRSGSTWVQQARLAPTDGQYGDHFGMAVAVSGNTIIVGAYDHKVGANNGQGAAYVYVRAGATWTLQQKLSASDGAQFDQFGLSVAINGDTAVIGALGDDVNATNDNRGSAYIFTRTGATWTQAVKLTASNEVAGTGFGTDVSVSGNTVVIGSPLETIGANQNQGSVYVYVRSGATWTQQQRINLSNGEAGDFFGISVDIDGETFVLGAAQGYSATASKGAAYVYVRAGATWTQQQKLVSSDVSNGDFFGRDVSISGDTIIAGAFGDQIVQDQYNQGSAYVFKRAGAVWTEQRKFVATDGSPGDFYGQHVAVSGNTIVVGAKGDNVGGLQGRGSAYIYSLDAGTNPTPTPTPTATPTPTPTPTPTATPTPTPSPTPATNTVQFTASSFEANEGAGGSAPLGIASGEVAEWEAAVAAAQGSASITVTRTGNLSQPASVDYATQTGTASDRSDYTAAFGTLRFAANENSKTIVVHITDDVFQESTESFTVSLSNPVGAALGSPASATVNVTSNDSTTGANPVKDGSFNSEFFVRQHYADFLGREPDAGGLQFWKNQIDECEQRPAAERQGCREVRRINVSAAFFVSIEFQETGYLVYRTFGASFGARRIGGTVPLTMREFLPDTQEIGRNVTVGTGNWEQQLEANKVAYFERFVERAQFLSAYPLSMTPAQFVDALNANTNNSLSQSERDALVAELASGAKTRAQVLRQVAEDADFKSLEFNRAFVMMQYFGYLRRNPNDSPDSNFDGYNFWLGKLNQFNGNYISAEMVKGFITSGEYTGRFGP